MQTKDYYVMFGCYLSAVEVHLIVQYPDTMPVSEVDDWVANEAYERAIQETEGWVGMYGFELDEELEDDEEAERELIENAAEYVSEPWAGQCEDAEVERITLP